MYKSEVPLYGDLIDIVRKVNGRTVQKTEGQPRELHTGIERLTLERHGAIRLGTPYELQHARRIFALLGMHPVGYYDLSSLEKNPFRVFTTLLRPELLKSDTARTLSTNLLAKRQIFSSRLLELLRLGKDQGGRFTAAQAEAFIPEALHTFRWQPVAGVSPNQYNQLRAEHLILADVVTFQSAHINHLTPRTLDINAAQRAMQEAGMAVKASIEGPPAHKCPILLRQTSFLVVEEPVNFVIDGEHALTQGSHKARFGEIEERGAVVTKGRALYDALCLAKKHGYLSRVFQRFPDDWDEMRKQGLVYCRYRVKRVQELASDGIIEMSPITYEVFLPFSAAMVFQSNLPAHGTRLRLAGR
ncbi:hypothetical protein BDV36DRAFT_289150 [Aspergillus pseudocaelatus]|uniref:2-oxoadipate dioxygenase/decarboxylase n=1 Tax=Aspergillus pseudocaelatus TaxID=1825620 RepID=A0ABQ6W1F3_9EURO|nr:hypothetical protein BDV36DRAFT_289150 [Aspergillus pseudocaelatus]